MHDVVNNEHAHQFEITIDGHTGFLRYAKSDRRINLIHTEVPPELGGRGLAGQLVQAALDHARDAKLQVTPTCPFVQKYIERHPEYASLVAGA